MNFRTHRLIWDTKLKDIGLYYHDVFIETVTFGNKIYRNNIDEYNRFIIFSVNETYYTSRQQNVNNIWNPLFTKIIGEDLEKAKLFCENELKNNTINFIHEEDCNDYSNVTVCGIRNDFRETKYYKYKEQKKILGIIIRKKGVYTLPFKGYIGLEIPLNHTLRDNIIYVNPSVTIYGKCSFKTYYFSTLDELDEFLKKINYVK